MARIDLSRQVSMDAARMGFPSATAGLNQSKNIKKSTNIQKSENSISPKIFRIYIYICIYIYMYPIYPGDGDMGAAL